MVKHLLLISIICTPSPFFKRKLDDIMTDKDDFNFFKGKLKQFYLESRALQREIKELNH